MTDTERVIRVVRKLLAQAHGAGTTPEESAAFAAKANELLLQHKLSLSEVQLSAEDEDEPIAKKAVYNAGGYQRRQKWLEDLAECVAATHFCRLTVSPPYNYYGFVGKTSDRELAAFMFETLATTAYRQGKEWANRKAREHQQRGERVPYRMLAGYLEGFALAVTTRLWQAYFDTRKAGGQHAALVFTGQMNRVNDWYKEHGPTTMAEDPKERYADYASMAEGVKAGKQVPLHGGIQPPETAKKPTISAARRQLGRGE